MAGSTPLTYTEALHQTPLSARLTRTKHHYTARLNQLHTDATSLAQLHHSYSQLSRQLADLPKRLSVEQRVPFGPLASFRGRLVRTNEWLVLLGGEWWLECTAERARRIAGERLKEVERRQGRVREEKKRVREWMEEGERVLGEAGGRRAEGAGAGGGGEEDDIVEIKEEYKEEDEEDMRTERLDTMTADRAKDATAAGGMTDAEFDAHWDKLAELEEEEERREEKKAQKEPRNDSARHTAHDRDTVAEIEAEEEPVALPAIRSPADIYKHMQHAAALQQQQQRQQQPAAPQPAVGHKAITSPKKRVSFSSVQPAVALIDPVSTRPLRHRTHSPPPPGASLLSHSAAAASAAVPPPSSNPALASAFSGAVLERDVIDDSSGSDAVQQQAPVAKKKMSRFMAERLGLKVDED